LRIVILAAGRGKRMVSSTPKILHKLGGYAMLEHVVRAGKNLEPASISVVYGDGGETVRNAMQHLDVEWIEQKEQLGTGHAVMQAIPSLADKDQVLVLYGDVPLISSKTLKHLLEDSPQNGLGLIVTFLDDPTGFGRIIRNEVSNIISIIEHKDASMAQRKINEINTGILTCQARHLKKWLPKLSKKNKQNEYYLTDIVSLAVEEGIQVGGIVAYDSQEVLGVNDRWQLTNLERYYQLTQAQRLAHAGVSIADPNRLDIRGDVEIASDVFLDINVILEGKVVIGSHCCIGPHVVLKNVEIGEGVEILAHSVIEGAKIAAHSQIGPFARIRPGTVIEKESKIGNFVEVKNVHLGKGSKANHLAYLGDATIGKNVNIGAGTIICNYDGVQKWHTHIQDGAFIGSNTALIAPVHVGENATVAAGSTISKDVPSGELSIARSMQKNITGWKRPQKKVKNKESVVS
jgi:bifunctional UDP-N-acetylglucosamine pyrophosphorylase/glucosamine-1-phosphate N-acetyltransferase